MIDTAVVESGKVRFRPVLLTSVTTVAGLFPLLLERSFQAQFLIPMAVSISFGLIAATVLTLLYVPALYLIVRDITNLFEAPNKEDDKGLTLRGRSQMIETKGQITEAKDQVTD